MTSRTAAARYARSLFDVALKEKVNLDEVEAQVAAFLDLFKQHPLLEKVLLNPAVPTPRKSAAMSEVLKHATLTPVVGKLLVLLADRDRLMLLPDLLEAYRLRLMDHQHVVRAEVTTATALSAERTGNIERSLATATGRRLTERLLPIAERYEAVALAGFSAAETKTLKAALRRLYVNMEALER